MGNKTWTWIEPALKNVFESLTLTLSILWLLFWFWFYLCNMDSKNVSPVVRMVGSHAMPTCGTPKPICRAFELLHVLGTLRSGRGLLQPPKSSGCLESKVECAGTPSLQRLMLEVGLATRWLHSSSQCGPRLSCRPAPVMVQLWVTFCRVWVESSLSPKSLDCQVTSQSLKFKS